MLSRFKNCTRVLSALLLVVLILSLTPGNAVAQTSNPVGVASLNDTNTYLSDNNDANVHIYRIQTAVDVSAKSYTIKTGVVNDLGVMYNGSGTAGLFYIPSGIWSSPLGGRIALPPAQSNWVSYTSGEFTSFVWLTGDTYAAYDLTPSAFTGDEVTLQQSRAYMVRLVSSELPRSTTNYGSILDTNWNATANIRVADVFYAISAQSSVATVSGSNWTASIYTESGLNLITNDGSNVSLSLGSLIIFTKCEPSYIQIPRKGDLLKVYEFHGGSAFASYLELCPLTQ